MQNRTKKEVARMTRQLALELVGLLALPENMPALRVLAHFGKRANTAASIDELRAASHEVDEFLRVHCHPDYVAGVVQVAAMIISAIRMAK